MISLLFWDHTMCQKSLLVFCIGVWARINVGQLDPSSYVGEEERDSIGLQKQSLLINPGMGNHIYIHFTHPTTARLSIAKLRINKHTHFRSASISSNPNTLYALTFTKLAFT